MTTLDIRTPQAQQIIEIRIADRDGSDYRADIIKKVAMADNGITLRDSDSGRYLEIISIAHANDMIKGIEKAKELGWLK